MTDQLIDGWTRPFIESLDGKNAHEMLTKDAHEKRVSKNGARYGQYPRSERAMNMIQLVLLVHAIPKVNKSRFRIVLRYQGSFNRDRGHSTIRRQEGVGGWSVKCLSTRMR